MKDKERDIFDDLCRSKLQDFEADTLAGLLLELKGEFPVLHEKVVYDCYEFEVLEMDNRRILKVKFTVNEPAGEGSETEK